MWAPFLILVIIVRFRATPASLIESAMLDWTINAFRSAVSVLEKRLERADARADSAEERVRELTEQNAQLREAKAAVEAEARLHKAELERLQEAASAPIRLADWQVWWSRFVARRRWLT
jgi:uncharacterized protein involved in exopolysaccharide biosynthesis